jgi:hypothetical protein
MTRASIPLSAIDFALYPSGEIAIMIVDREGDEDPNSFPGERLGVATTALVEAGYPRPAPGCVWLKTWSENTGIAEALVAGGVVELNSEACFVGPFRLIALGARLTPAALEAFKRQQAGRAP